MELSKLACVTETEPTSGPTRTTRRAAANREAIIDVAEALLMEGGLGAVTVEAVAERADVAIQTVYNRVGRRPEVLVAVAERAAGGQGVAADGHGGDDDQERQAEDHQEDRLATLVQAGDGPSLPEEGFAGAEGEGGRRRELHYAWGVGGRGVPETPMYLDALLADQPLTGGLEPQLGDAHLRILTIIGFPTATTPGVLDELNRLAFPYRWATRAILLDKTDAAPPRYLTCPTRRRKLILRIQRRPQPMNRPQLGFGPLAQLGHLAVGGEAPDLCEDLLSGCEVGQR